MFNTSSHSYLTIYEPITPPQIPRLNHGGPVPASLVRLILDSAHATRRHVAAAEAPEAGRDGEAPPQRGDSNQPGRCGCHVDKKSTGAAPHVADAPVAVPSSVEPRARRTATTRTRPSRPAADAADDRPPAPPPRRGARQPLHREPRQRERSSTRGGCARRAERRHVWRTHHDGERVRTD